VLRPELRGFFRELCRLVELPGAAEKVTQAYQVIGQQSA
jgi:hypothetical protein